MKPRFTHHLMAALLSVVFTAELHAQLVVTSAANSGPGSLRQTIANSKCASAVIFYLSVYETELRPFGRFHLLTIAELRKEVQCASLW